MAAFCRYEYRRLQGNVEGEFTMMSVLPSVSQLSIALAAWVHRRRRADRRRALEEFYAAELAKLGSLSARVSFHLYHLERYWWRCLGFFDASKPTSASFLAGDWLLTVLIGSEAATPDIARYAAEHHHPELHEAWQQYAKSLVQARRGIPDIERGLREASARFATIRSMPAAAEFQHAAPPAFDQRQN